LKAEHETDLKTEFENDPEDEMGTEFENDPKVEVETEYQNDPERMRWEMSSRMTREG